jgi:hypothetical protein
LESGNVRFLVSSCLICLPLLSVVLFPWESGLAEAAGISPEHDPWGHFEPGAWKKVRVETVRLDEDGIVTRTDKTTTLLNVEDEGVTLEHEFVNERGGERSTSEPETVQVGFHGELLTEGLKVSNAGNAEVDIEGRKIACDILQVESSGPTGKTVTKVYYSSSVAPYVLRRESVTTDPEGTNSRVETTEEVVALQMPEKVLADFQKVAYVKTVVKHPKGSTTTWSATSTEVPGGVVRQASKVLDTAGHLIRTSTLELIDYGLELEPERKKLFEPLRRGLLRRRVPLVTP